MKQVLILKSSILEQHSQSNACIDAIKPLLADYHLIERDLARDPLPILDSATLSALNGKQPNAIQALADQLLTEVKHSDFMIVAAPMYNFMIPTQLKAWLDLLCRAGVTFQYTEQGPVGLLENKPVLVVTSRGGVHQSQPSDFIAPYLTKILDFIGISDVEFIYAEGLNMGNEQDQAAVIGQVKQNITQYLTQHFALG